MKTNSTATPAAEQPETTADATPTPEMVSEITALKAEVEDLRKIAKANEALAKTAEIDKLTTQAKAQVEAWMREGKLSGNSVAKVEAIYVAACTGQPITRVAIEEMMAALPRLSTSRLATDAKSAETQENKPTADDFRAADKGNHKMKTRIDLYVKSLCVADPKKNYVAHMREARAAAFSR
jgi:hypothetical protein